MFIIGLPVENPNLKMGFIVCEAKRQNYRQINQKVLRDPSTLQLGAIV